MSGFGNYIKRIEGKVDVDTIRETERFGLRLGTFDEVVDAAAARHRESCVAYLGTLSEYDGPTESRDEVGEHYIVTDELRQIYDAAFEQLGVDPSSEQQSGVRSTDGHDRSGSEDSDGDAIESPTIPAGLGTWW